MFTTCHEHDGSHDHHARTGREGHERNPCDDDNAANQEFLPVALQPFHRTVRSVKLQGTRTLRLEAVLVCPQALFSTVASLAAVPTLEVIQMGRRPAPHAVLETVTVLLIAVPWMG
jgi:hypothetical protein